MHDVSIVAQQHVARATRASLQGDFKEALAQLVEASTHYAEAIASAATREQRKDLLVLFDECAEEAERMKQRSKATEQTNGTSLRLPRCPLRNTHNEAYETRVLSKKEQVLLLKSSKVGERVYPIWNDANIDVHVNVNAPYQDSTRIFRDGIAHSFRRLTDSVIQPTMSDADLEIYSSIAQCKLNDCSLVSSLIVVSQWSFRFRAQLATLSLYPQSVMRQSVISQYGKYMMKIYLNGTYRQVIVDDFLPTDEDGSVQTILSFSSRYPEICWPAILEKVFLKVSGDCFKGSNTGLDLRLLIGWLPEEIALSTSTDTATLWSKIFPAWNTGDVLITIGSSLLSKEQELDSNIVSNHSYAITGLSEQGGQHILSLQNPWKEESSSSVDPSNEHQRSFDIILSLANHHFSNIFLSWNPRCWSHKATLHFQSTPDQFSLTDLYISDCPQFVVTNETDSAAKVFFLLERHQIEGAMSFTTSIAIFSGSRRRHVLEHPLHHSDSYASPIASLHWTISARSAITVVVLMHKLDTSRTSTLTCLSRTPLSLEEATTSTTLPFKQILQGEWTTTSAGGPPPGSKFVHNPQYLLSKVSGDVCIVLEATGLDVNFAVTYGHERPLSLAQNNTAFTPKQYRRDAQSSTTRLAPGNYSLILSTNKPDQCGTYKLTLLSQEELSLVPARILGAGQVKTVLQSHWPKEFNIQRFQISSTRSNIATIYIHGRNRSLTIRCSVSANESVLHRSEGQGSVGIERVALRRNATYQVSCESLGLKGLQDFEIIFYSDSMLTIARC